jgi:type IV fimbrial biogenesis protein FimT
MGRRVGAKIRVERGFSMVELLTTLAIVALLATLVAPSLRNVLVKQQVASATHALAADLQTARTLAISRAQLVGVIAIGGNCKRAPTAPVA